MKTIYYPCVQGYPQQCSSQELSSCCTYTWPNGTVSWNCDNLGTFQVNGCGPEPTGGNGNGNAPAPTPTPPSALYCGDGSCNNGETCSTCPNDCGICLTSTLQARAWVIRNTDISCNAVATGSLTPTTFGLDAGYSAPKVQTDANYVSWAGNSAGTYTLYANPPAGYILRTSCWARNVTSPVSGTGVSAAVGDNETLSWDLGYTAGVPWVQALGGDVYASGTLTSYVPPGATPRYFDLAPTGGTAGVVTYGTGYDFANGAVGKGASSVSVPGWLTQETHAATDYYALMFNRFGSPTVADYTGPTTFSTIPSSPPKNGSAYYVDGDLTIDTNSWSVGTGQSIVILVNGTLIISKPINITGTGFAAFIAHGDIRVDTTVGTTAASATPVVEGVYITSPTGTFHTGASTTAAARRFVGKGTFIAGNFALERDLDADGANNTTSSELFIYNPALLIRQPDAMKNVPISWQEVAP